MEPATSSNQTPPQPPNPPPPPTPIPSPSKWVLVAGLIFGTLTFLFFVGLVIAAVSGRSVPPNARLLVMVVLAIGIALSASFLGGTASASGKLPLPGNMDPVAFGVAGGIAVFVIVLLIGACQRL
jgi:hypothetical protein